MADDPWAKYERADVAAPDTSAASEPAEDPWARYEKVEVKQTLDGNALSRGLSRGSDMTGQAIGSMLESIGEATGFESLEESGRARAVRNRAELQNSTPSMTTDDIDGLGSLGGYVAEKIGETALPMAASAGAALAATVAGAGTVVVGGAASLASLPQMFGSYRERQKDEDIAAGREIEVDEGAALLAAIPAAAMEGVSDVFLLGPLSKTFKPLMQGSGLLTRVTTNAATGASVEGLTEVGQAVLERQQAGLSLTDEEAQKEYFEAAVAGGLVGGAVSGATSVRRPKPTVENVGGGTDAEQRAALNSSTTRTETSQVAPDQAAALGATPPPAQTDGAKARELLTRMRAKKAADPALARKATDPMSDDFEAPGRKTPAPAAAVDLTPEQRLAANKQAATETGATVAAPVTPAGNVAPVLDATEQVETPTEQVVPAPVTSPTSQAAQGIERGMAAMAEGAKRAGRQRVADLIAQGQPVTYRNPEAVAQAKADPQQVVVDNPDGSVTVTGIKVDEASEWIGTAPEEAPVTEGTELDETLLADTALNEEVPAGAEAAGDTIPTVPEAPETIAAQGAALVDRKNKRKAVYLPPETMAELDADDLPSGKNIYTMTLPNGGQLFWNYTKIGLGKKDVTKLYKDGNLGKLLGLGPFNKAEVAASGGEQDLAVREITSEGVPVKDVAATEVTAPAQAAALEAEKTEGSTIEVTPAEDVIAERQAAPKAAPKAAAVKAKSKGRAEQAPVRTLKDIDPEEIARIEAAANAKPAAPKAEAPKAEAAKQVRAKRTVDVTDEVTRQRNIDAADEQAFLRKRAALEEEVRTKKEEELAARKAEVQKKIDDNAFESVEDEATARIEANRTAESKDKGRDTKKVSLAVKAGRLLEQLRESMKIRAGNRPVTGFALVSDLETAKAVGKEMRAVLVEAKKQGVTIGKHVDDTVTNAMAFLIDLRTTAVKLEKLPSINDDATRETIIDEANSAVMDLNAYLLGNDAAGIRERRAIEGVTASAGAGELDVDAVVDENATLDNDEETDESDPDDYELAPSYGRATSEDIAEFSVGDRAIWMSDEGRSVVTISGVTTKDGELFYKVRSADGTVDEVAADSYSLFGVAPALQISAGGQETASATKTGEAKPKGPLKVEVRKSRASVRAAAQQVIRERMNAPTTDPVAERTKGDRLTLKASEKPLGKDADEKLVENLRPDDLLGMEIMDRVTSSGKALSDMTLAERTALFKDVDGVDPKKVEASIAIAKLPLARFQALLEGKSFLRSLARNLKFMDAMPAAIQKALGTDLLAQMNRIAGDVEVLVVEDADMPALAPGKDGYFWPRGDYIVIRASLFESANAARLQHTVTHEAGHAALWHAIRNSARLRKQLEAVLGAASKYANRMGIKEFTNGLRNADEFASELVSNTRFMDFLSSVTLSKADLLKLGIRPSLVAQVRNALDAIKIKLLDAIGWDTALRSVGLDPNSPNALTAGLDIIGNLLDVAPAARTRFQEMVAESEAAVAKDSDTGVYGRLKQRGLDAEQALNVAAIIDEEFGGTATDEELDALVGALGKPVGSQQGLTGPSPFMPPKLPGRVAKVLNWNPRKASKTNKAILYASTLDFIDTKFRPLFGDKLGNALSDYVNAAFKYKKIADDVAALHDRDWADFEDLRKAKPDEAAKIQELVALLEATDIDISDGATNDHLKNTKARRYLQSKAALADVQNIMASMEPETLELTRRMADNFTASHDDYIRTVTYEILEGLDTKLSNSDLMRIMDHVVNSKLDAQDKADVNDDAVYALLERSEFLKKRKGSYFPAERFGEHVVLTETAVADPKITSVVTKSGRKTVPVKTEVDGGTVRFIFDYTVRGANPAVTKKVYDWVANHELPLSSYVVRYRDRQSGEIVGKGEMDVTKDYDMVHEVKLQNKGVHFFEDEKVAYAFEAQAIKDKAAGKLLSHTTVLPKHAETHREHLIPPGALDAVFSSIDRNTKLDAGRKEQLKNAAREAITRNMVGNRYEKRLMGRQNILGASDEVGRAAAYYGRSVGNAIARIRSGGERAEALARMRAIAESKRSTPGEGNTAELVVNEIVTREGLDLGPVKNNQILDNLATLNSVDKLLSPANWFLNAMQVPMNSLPFIGGRFGNVKAAHALRSAYKLVGAAGVAKAGLKNTKTAITQMGKHNLDLDDVLGSVRKNVGMKYKDLFDALVETNDIAENVGIENASQLAAGRGAAGTALVKMDRIMRAMPNAIETINRSVAAVASYNLAIESGMSKADAIAYTRETLRRTQFRYDETNKSRMMRSNPALRFFFTFKQYGQGQYQMFADALGRALKDASPAERAMARKQLYTMFAMQVAVAGVFSMPAIEIIKTAVMLGAAMGLGDGWDEDVVDPLRELMRETFGMTIEEIASKGIMSKILGVDLSGRMSWADLFIGYPPRSGDKQDLLAWVGNAIAGPQGTLVYEMFFGAPKAMLEGDFAKALGMVLPVKAVSDTVKAAAGVVDGTMKPMDAVKQVVGFKSLRQARISDEKGVSIRKASRKKKDVNDLIGDYLSAVSRGDVAKAASAIRDYNKTLGKDEREISLKGLEKRRRKNAQTYQD